ncbi:hypothetical protein DV737_g430, partial [Chaetothyriales sp. CBS 132003]
MANTNPADYKARKEAFVSNLSGSSITEINLVTLVAAAAAFLWTALQKRYGFFQSYGLLAFTTDFLLNVGAILFAVTAYSSAPLFLNLALITPASPPRLVVRPFLTHYRGAMLVVTVVAILAVDFPIFPRRFAKVETWGTSLMDLGVGSFVFSAGVVSSRALFKTSRSGKRPHLASRVLQASRHAIPLLVLGIIRLISVKGLDYAEHVTEYGVHWNFFFTMALLPPFVELADALVDGFVRPRSLSYALLALAISLVYEVVLDNTSLLAYILISPRGPDLLSKNREGVFSFIGYLAIFLSGRGTGSTVVQLRDDYTLKAPKHLNASDLTVRERQRLLRGLAAGAAIPVALYCLSTSIYAFNLTVSRRLANLPYVLWVVAFNHIQIYLFALIEACGPQFSYEEADRAQLKSASSKIMQVFNKNGLVIFLVANLLTGLVNLTFNTLDASGIQAMAILIAYSAARLSSYGLVGAEVGLEVTPGPIKKRACEALAFTYGHIVHPPDTATRAAKSLALANMSDQQDIWFNVNGSVYFATGDNTNCTIAVCPVWASVYGYRPSLPFSSLLIALYALCMAIQVGLGVYYKTWSFMAAVLVGCIVEILGYAARILMYNNPWGDAGFIMQIVLITIGPVFFAAAIYVMIYRIVLYISPSSSRVPPVLFYWIFITCDIISLVLQAVGGAMSSTSNGGSQAGVNIALAGLAFQVATLTSFCVLAIDFAWRSRRISTTTGLPRRFLVFVFFLSAAAIFILIRCCYRVYELSEGYSRDSEALRSQPPFIALEGVMIVAAAWCLVGAHPGPVFYSSAARQDKRSLEEKLRQDGSSTTTDEEGKTGVVVV